MGVTNGLIATAADGLLTDRPKARIFWIIRTMITAAPARVLSNAYFASAKQVAQIIVNEA
jgi:hypothetical protein